MQILHDAVEILPLSGHGSFEMLLVLGGALYTVGKNCDRCTYPFFQGTSPCRFSLRLIQIPLHYEQSGLQGGHRESPGEEEKVEPLLKYIEVALCSIEIFSTWIRGIVLQTFHAQRSGVYRDPVVFSMPPSKYRGHH
jgi:hypothetical protein